MIIDHDISSFSYLTVINSVEAEVSVVWVNPRYSVLLNRQHVAQVDLNYEDCTWYVVSGNLSNERIIKEIGEYIEDNIDNLRIIKL